MSDFHFSHPRLLYLALLLLPLLAWWVWQRRGSVRHPVASRLVGLPVGRARLSFWGGTDELVRNWAVDKRWKPTMNASERQRLQAGWAKALTRAIDWV